MQLPTISVDKILLETCPTIQLGVLLTNVKVAPAGSELSEVIRAGVAAQKEKLTRETIAKIPALLATRQAYKALGKDPSRYRPSAEALLRRVVSGKGLYQVNNVVDALNLVSVESGFSIGGYDFDKINGPIRLGRGAADEPYEAIGRGELNIEGLPVLRDESGAFGTPTSDSTRTMVTADTRKFLMVFFGFSKNDNLENMLAGMENLLEKFAAGERIGAQVLSFGK